MDGNLFSTDLTTSLRGAFPIPPTLSEDAGELLTEWLTEAFWVDSCLHQRTFRLVCVPTAKLESLATEILRVKFPMPCEGVDEPIPTIDHVSVLPAEIRFTINPIYAAYLLSAVPDDVTARGHSTEKRRLPLFAPDLPLLIAALQSHHMSHTTGWNCQAIHFGRKGAHPLPRESFSLPEIEQLIHRLGGSVAP
jgi:hypothetical protein